MLELDLSLANSTNECRVFEVELLGITTKHFYPKPGYLAKGVKDSTKELWKAQPHYSRVGIKGKFGGPNDDYCLSCLIYEGSVELLELTVIESKSRKWKYFEKCGKEWKEIEKEDFDKKLDDMKRESEVPLHPVGVSTDDHASVPPKEVIKRLGGSAFQSLAYMEGTTLEISSPSPSLFTVTDHVLYGVNHRAFVPKDGCSLVSVVDNRDTLWTSKDGEEFTGVHQYSREGYPSLLSVYTRGAGDETFCFEKDGNQWKNVDKRYFEHRLHSMKDLYAPAGEKHREEDTWSTGIYSPEGESYS